MNWKNASRGVVSNLVVVTGLLMAPVPGYSDTGGQVRRDNRQEARDTKQEGRQDAREDKAECRAGDEKSRPECRQDKRQDKQDARETARDIKY